MNKDVKTVGLYIRVSTSKQAEFGYSLEGQKRKVFKKFINAMEKMLI